MCRCTGKLQVCYNIDVYKLLCRRAVHFGEVTEVIPSSTPIYAVDMP